MKTDTVPIRGMTCAVCARATEKAAGTVPGVARASVNFGTEVITIE